MPYLPKLKNLTTLRRIGHSIDSRYSIYLKKMTVSVALGLLSYLHCNSLDIIVILLIDCHFLQRSKPEKYKIMFAQTNIPLFVIIDLEDASRATHEM